MRRSMENSENSEPLGRQWIDGDEPLKVIFYLRGFPPVELAADRTDGLDPMNEQFRIFKTNAS